MAFYEGIDEEIYEGGDHYMPMQQFRLNQNYRPTTVTPDVVPTSTSYGIPTLYPYVNMGGDGGYRGGGLFGDLDPNKTKTFSKEVWEDADANTPGSGGWATKDVQGFFDPKSGQYKTWEGKNINHLGLEFPTIAGALFDKSFGKGPQSGDIKGTFTGGWDEGMENIKEGWEEEKDKWSELLGIDKAKAFFKNIREERLQEEILAHNKKAAAEAAEAAAATAPQGPQWHTSAGGQDQPGAGGQNVKSSSGDVYGGEAFGYNEAAEKSDYFAKGGRVYLNLGGLASMLGREGLAPGGPAGGASAGGNYGGNVNPEQEYAGRTFEETYGGGDNQNNTVTVPTNNYINIDPNVVQGDPYVNLSVKSPLDVAKLQAMIGYRDILDNDDLSVEGDLTTNIGPIDTNTQFTEDGIGNTDINWGNFSATIDENKNLQNLGYNNSLNGFNYGLNYGDGNTMFTIGTTFKNGGLASIL